MSSNPSDAVIRMTSKERSVFERLVATSNAYLEYGCGGSTEIASQIAKGVVVSIESDALWVKALKEKLHIREAIAKGKLHIQHVDIGPVGDWGVPKDETKIRNWPQYFLTPFTKYDFLYDLILIDGRFRPSCAYAAFALANDSVTVIIHDYAVRTYYHDVEKFFNIVEQVDTLVVLEKKNKILQRSLYTSLLNSIFVP